MTGRNIKKGSFKKGEDAVSPVIGVILMVAITVILAAVIGAFVFGMGTPEATPIANVVITAAETDIDNDLAPDNTIRLEHKGGDDLALKDVKILVKTDVAGTATTLTIDPASTIGAAFGPGQTMDILTSVATSGAVLIPAGADGVSTAGTSDSVFVLTAGKTVEVEFWYKPTGQQIAAISKSIVE